MIITVPDELLKGTSFDSRHALLDLALGMYADRRATLGQAASIAGMTQTRFLKELGSRRVPMHYDVAAFEHDMAVMEHR